MAYNRQYSFKKEYPDSVFGNGTVDQSDGNG